MIITARFNGLCFECGLPTLKGSEIDYADKKARHVECAPVEATESPAEDAHALAERLGFRADTEV